MDNNVLLFGKIAARSFLGWLMIMIGGYVISIIGLVTAVILWNNQAGSLFDNGLLGFLLALAFLLVSEFWTGLLLFGSIAAFFFYTSLASKYGIQKAIHLTWEYKLGELFTSRLEKYLSRIFDKKKKEVEVPLDATMIKQAIVREVKQDPQNNKIQKKIFQYLLRRMRLNDIDFSDPHLNVRSVIIQKLKEVISDMIEPSMVPFWIMFGVQVFVLVMALLYDHH